MAAGGRRSGASDGATPLGGGPADASEEEALVERAVGPDPVAPPAHDTLSMP